MTSGLRYPDEHDDADELRRLVHKRLTDMEGREEEVGITREQIWEQVDQRRAGNGQS